MERARIAGEIVAREQEASGRPFDAAFLDRIRGNLANLSLEQLAEVQQRASGLLPIPNILGSTQADLVYTPVAPCRIIDTRSAGGPIVAGFTRNFQVTGTDLSLQGGSGTGCGVPFGPATAAVINLVAVGPAGAGDLRITPFGTAIPLASIINYSSGLNLANGPAITLCDPASTTCTFDFTIQADVSATNLVADVLGYFAAPLRTALENVKEQTAAITIAAGATGVVMSPTCPAGYTITGGGGGFLNTTVGLAVLFFHPFGGAGSPFTTYNCGGSNGTASSASFVCTAVCSRVPGR
jgi:hypothetical protein